MAEAVLKASEGKRLVAAPADIYGSDARVLYLQEDRHDRCGCRVAHRDSPGCADFLTEVVAAEPLRGRVVPVDGSCGSFGSEAGPGECDYVSGASFFGCNFF